ncbi:MAG: saccharopine dehydrogenase C-terminal domain-containing protein [Bacteroidales bacterium]|jgi:saccharopine dehydrogenase-like NADP-dependent oxidoreductase
MKKVLILGAGLVAKPMIQYLLGKNFKVTVASNTSDRAEVMVGNHPSGHTIFWEADDEETLDTMVARHDLTVSLLPYRFHVMVAKHCLKHKKNLVTASYVKPEMMALDEEAKQAGILFLNEMGLDPGIDHMSAMRIIDEIHANEGAVLEFYSLCGALPAPEAANNPFRYKFSWSPKGVILAGNNDAHFLCHGKEVNIPTQDIFKNPFEVDFPEVGMLDVYPNRDSMAYRTIYGISEARTVYRGTFRYKGWCETLDVMKRLNLISSDTFDMKGMTYADMIAHQIGKRNSTNIRQHVATFLNIPVTSYALDALEWLGMFKAEPMGRGIDSTFEVTSDRMISRMGLGPEERDMVILQHTILAGYSNGRKEIIRSRMLDFGTLATNTSIARTVALPAAIGAEMILLGKITVKGVHIPVIPGIYNPVLDQLESMNIRMVEEYGLPLSENIA